MFWFLVLVGLSFLACLLVLLGMFRAASSADERWAEKLATEPPMSDQAHQQLNVHATEIVKKQRLKSSGQSGQVFELPSVRSVV